MIESWTIRNTPHQVMLILQRDGIAAGVVQTAEDLYRDPHLRERGFARDVYLPQVGWVTRVGPSVRLTESDVSRSEFPTLRVKTTKLCLVSCWDYLRRR